NKRAGGYTPASWFNPLVTPELDAILARMLARDPDQRYGSVSALIQDLCRCLLACPVSCYPELRALLEGAPLEAQADQKTRPDPPSPLAQTRPRSMPAGPWYATTWKLLLGLAAVLTAGALALARPFRAG